MEFGLFFEISVPRPWGPESEHRVYKECIDQVELADRLGFDQVWVVEHHFLEEHSHVSAPDLFLMACAGRTQQIRLGHGIVVCVPQLNHPVRLAERAATLDILSDGRLEFGTGRATSWTELSGYGANPDETKKTWDEFVRVIPQMWTQEKFGYNGRSFSMPKRPILPKPYQKPHPPMWVAVTSPGTEIDAAERGLGGLFLSFSGVAQQEKRVAEYRRRIQTCKPVGKFVNNQVSLVNFLYCHEDDDHGSALGRKLAATYTYISGQVLSVREVYPTPSYPTSTPQSRARVELERKGPDEPKVPEGLCVGNPERVIEALKKWEAIGVDRVNFLLNVVDLVPQEAVLASMRLFAREVMPHFTKRPATEAAFEDGTNSATGHAQPVAAQAQSVEV
ncbi:MAG: LLM class flavin-dependent oxidoreductase [Dehalococcoidia bacterium]